MSIPRRVVLLVVVVSLLVTAVVVLVLRSGDARRPEVTLRSTGDATTTSFTSSTTTSVETTTTSTPAEEVAAPTTTPPTTTAVATPTTAAPPPRPGPTSTTTTPPPAGPPTIEANAGDIGARGVYVATVDGRLRHLADATHIGLDVSPDGRRIAYLHDHRLFTVAVDGGAPREIPGMGRVVNRWDNPAWSPDGRSLAAIRLDPDGGYRIAVSTDGRAGRVIAGELTGVAALDWAADSSAVIASSGNAVWSAALGGGAATKLADTSPYNAGFIETSPDGSKVAYAIYEGLVVMAPDGSNPRKIATLPYGGYFSWSPDSSQLAHAVRGAERSSSSGLAVTAADGSSTTTIVKEFSGPARWASSGLLAFSTQEGDRTHYDLIRPDGSDRRRLVTDIAPSRTRADHVWDPTGSWIAFTSGTGGDGT